MKKAAQVVLINNEGLILGVSRKHDHNDFGLPGGKMDPEDGNNPIITAMRETKEETGLDVSNLELIFAIHKHGYMSYTYLAKWKGEINYTEPHIVKWITKQKLMQGGFGLYNRLVIDSLEDMGYKFKEI